MNETIPLWSRPANASVLALVIALALLVAPACAPLCAARACSSGVHKDQCHEMAATGASGGEQLVAATKVCAAADFSAVLVKANGLSSVSQEVRSDAAPALIGGSLEHGLGGFDESQGRFSLHRVPLKSDDPLLLTTILRI